MTMNFLGSLTGMNPFGMANNPMSSCPSCNQGQQAQQPQAPAFDPMKMMMFSMAGLPPQLALMMSSNNMDMNSMLPLLMMSGIFNKSSPATTSTGRTYTPS